MNGIDSFLIYLHVVHDKRQAFLVKKIVLIKSCIDNKIVCHSNTLRPHRMFFGINKFADNWIVKISNLFICRIVFEIHVNIINIELS
jgi:hypothetical protein